MPGPIEIVKAHPVLTIGGVIGVVVLVMLVSSGSAAASDGGSVASASVDPMAALNAQIAAHSADVQASKEIALDTNAANLKVAQMNSDSALAVATLQEHQNELALHLQETQAQLAAGVSQSQIAADAATKQQQIAAALSQSNTQTQAQVTIAKQQADVSKAQIGAQSQNNLFGFIGNIIGGLFSLF